MVNVKPSVERVRAVSDEMQPVTGCGPWTGRGMPWSAYFDEQVTERDYGTVQAEGAGAR
jgi:hypothetical protein